MKILFFSHIFPNHIRPTWGIFLKEMAIEMSKKVNVRIIAPLPVFPFMDFFPSFAGSRDVPFEESCGSLKILRPKFLSFPKYIKWTESITLYRSIYKNIDIVHRYGADCDVFFTHWVFPDTYIAVKLAKKLGKKTALIIHGQKSIGFRETNLRKLFINYTIKQVDKILVFTQWMKEHLTSSLGIPYQKIELIFNGVDINKFKPLDMMHQRSKLNLPKDKKIIVALGRLSPEKGFSLILDAFKKVYKAERLYLIIVGDGPLRTKIAKKIKKYCLTDNILVVGTKPHHEIPYWLNACDMLCSPSYREEYGLNVVEALCCGKPVIATPFGIAGQVIIKGLNGILVPPGNSSDLGHAFSWVCQQKWSTEKIASSASRFSLDKSVDNILKILRNISRS